MLRRSQVCSALRFFRCAQKTGSGLRPRLRSAGPHNFYVFSGLFASALKRPFQLAAFN
ncbi:hypothetical protein SGRA_4183 [Saprospira grandis str. Lewin]|uniref:Uncharacterized protein n=1 Tax=Saprospira grandis (strain Lewin) TaxID=984262 RepID=H6L8U2_SAPGL|nr:hypothetical protein SGRA_4183 [Saprospira grandis str. Lewin]